MNGDRQLTLMQIPALRPYLSRRRALQMAGYLLLLVLGIHLPEVIFYGLATCLFVVYEMMFISYHIARALWQAKLVATVVGRICFGGFLDVVPNTTVTASTAESIWKGLQAATRALSGYAAVYGRSIEGSYIQKVQPPDDSSAQEMAVCTTLACRVATFAWWLIGHFDTTSAMVLGALVVAVIFSFGLWRLYQVVQNLLTTSERLVAQVERLQAKVAHPDPIPLVSFRGPPPSLTDSKRRAAQRRLHRVSKRSWRQTPSEQALSTASRTGSDDSGIAAVYETPADTPTPDPTSTSPHHSTPGSPTGDSAVTQHHQLEESTGHATPIGADDRAAATQDTAAGQPEDSTPAVSTENQAAPPILPADEAASSISTPTSDPIPDSNPNPTPTPTTQATEDETDINLHPSEDQAVHPTAAVAAASNPIAQTPMIAQAPVDADALDPAPAPASTHPSGSSAVVHTQEVVDEVAVDDSAAMQDQFMSGIQVLLRFAEGAINPAQGPLPTPITPGSADQGAPNPLNADFALRTVDTLLGMVDNYQQDSNFTAAATLMDQVVSLAHGMALTPTKQVHLYGRRARANRAAGRPVAAFADLLHAAQVYPASSATFEVMNQLVRWGNFDALTRFFQEVHMATANEGFHRELKHRMHTWQAISVSIGKVLAKEPCPGEPGEALLAEVVELVSNSPDNQALVCLQARQLMQLDRMGDTLQTVSGFVGVGNGMSASRWALHVTVHVRWLIGGLDQMVVSLKLLVTTNPSPLEEGVNYTVPDNSVLSALLIQLEELQALWEGFHRLRPEDLDGKEAVLQQVDTMSRGIMSPALRSRQLLLWADLHKARALGMDQAPPRLVVKALVSAERARVLLPSCWRKAVRVWGPLLEMLGSGRALYDLCSSILAEPDLTAEESVDYTERRSKADPMPFFCNKWDARDRPSLNPVQLLGVTFASSHDEVMRAAKPLLLLCHSDKACLPGNSFVRELEGVGALVGKTHLEAMGRLQTACYTVSLVNQAAYTLTNRYLKAHAEAWMSFRYAADKHAGILVPAQFVHMVGSGQEWVQAVRVARSQAAGSGEHQDLAPHELDAEQSSEAGSEAKSEEYSTDGSYSDEELVVMRNL